jgi:hypothetical protein
MAFLVCKSMYNLATLVKRRIDFVGKQKNWRFFLHGSVIRDFLKKIFFEFDRKSHWKRHFWFTCHAESWELWSTSRMFSASVALNPTLCAVVFCSVISGLDSKLRFTLRRLKPFSQARNLSIMFLALVARKGRDCPCRKSLPQQNRF